MMMSKLDELIAGLCPHRVGNTKIGHWEVITQNTKGTENDK
jgi:hypothetical protein